MSEAPERIWLELEKDFASHPGHAWIQQYDEHYIEYVRADLYLDVSRAWRQRIEALEQELAEYRKEQETRQRFEDGCR